MDCDGVLTVDDDCDDADSKSSSSVNDMDCDGVLAVDDCDDLDPSIYPFAGDTMDDDIDSDCDGLDCEAASDGESYFLSAVERIVGSRLESNCHSAGYDGLASILDVAENDFILSLMDTDISQHIGLESMTNKTKETGSGLLGSAYLTQIGDQMVKSLAVMVTAPLLEVCVLSWSRSLE